MLFSTVFLQRKVGDSNLHVSKRNALSLVDFADVIEGGGRSYCSNSLCCDIRLF